MKFQRVPEARVVGGRAVSLTLLAITVALAGCATQSPRPMRAAKHSKEYFPESKYGVKASPRVAGFGKPMPRGGGRDQTGQPYMVKGRWYYPKEDKHYVKVGRASWYGEAFHGRLTANGEVYDMAHLTAAHPTMPLPSYARVTNLTNGRSVIVRVNDRGPYEHDRVIDLSWRAADLLDYRHHGTANVKVEYVGRAPLDGNDDSYLLASYRDGKGGSPLIGQPATGVMMAMNGPTPTSRATRRAPTPVMPEYEPVRMASYTPEPVVRTRPVRPQPAPIEQARVEPVRAEPARQVARDMSVEPQREMRRTARREAQREVPPLPANLPFKINPAYGGPNDGTSASLPARRRQQLGMAEPAGVSGLAGYASARTASMLDERTYGAVLSDGAVSAAWKQSADEPREYVDLGLFGSLDEAKRLEGALPVDAKVSRQKVSTEKGDYYQLTASAADGDALLRAAWKAGAKDAFVVHLD